MVPVTLVVMCVGVLLVLKSPPTRALGWLAASCLLYPEYLRVPLGLLQLSCPRLMATVLLIKLWATGTGKFEWRLPDYLVLTIWTWDLFANLIAGAPTHVLTNFGGIFLDTVLMYFASRRVFTNRGSYSELLLPISITALIAGALGVQEAFTGNSPLRALYQYHTWVWIRKEDMYRFGLMRAQGATAHAIYYGISMLVIVGFLVSLRPRDNFKQSLLWQASILVGMLGVLMSLSSGPVTALGAFVVFLSFHKFPGLIKPAILVAFATAFVLQLVSNRSVFYLVSYLDPIGGGSWYRAALMEVALQMLPEYWLFGTGGVRPDHWGEFIDTREHVDLVNNYIIQMVRGGVPSLLLFVTCVSYIISSVVKQFRRASGEFRFILFSLTACYLAVLLSGVSCGLFGSSNIFAHILLGALASLGMVPISSEKGGREKQLLNIFLALKKAMGKNDESDRQANTGTPTVV